MDYRAEVEIPFKDKFKEPMLSGVKIMTARTRKMADPELKKLREATEKRAKTINPIKYVSKPKLWDISHFIKSNENLEIEEKPIESLPAEVYPLKRLDYLKGLVLHLQNKLNKHLDFKEKPIIKHKGITTDADIRK